MTLFRSKMELKGGLAVTYLVQGTGAVIEVSQIVLVELLVYLAPDLVLEQLHRALVVLGRDDLLVLLNELDEKVLLFLGEVAFPLEIGADVVGIV